MYRLKVCSICGWRGHEPRDKSLIWTGPAFPPEVEAKFEASDAEALRHINIECGNWDQLCREVERQHNLRPDFVEAVLREVIRHLDRTPGEHGEPASDA